MVAVRKSVFVIMSVFALSCLGVEEVSVQQFEGECCQALKDASILTGTYFRDRLMGVANSATDNVVRVDAMLTLALSEYRLFLDSMDASHLQMWRTWSTNALEAVACAQGSSVWQYSCARFLDAAYYAAKDDFQVAYAKSTNAIEVVTGCIGVYETNQLDSAVSNFYKMDEVPSLISLKILAGASAAKIGYAMVATNLAEQVHEPHRTKILSYCQ